MCVHQQKKKKKKNDEEKKEHAQIERIFHEKGKQQH